MIKRVTAIFFILMANIILLAHAAIPHHHHNNRFCIIDLHAQTGCEAHQHDATEHHHHEHDGNKNSELCVLKQDIVIPSNQLKLDCKSFEYKDNHSPFNNFQAIIFKNELSVFAPIFVSCVQKILKTSGHACFISSAIGLRAPPIA